MEDWRFDATEQRIPNTKVFVEKSLVIGTDGGDNCIGFYFGEPTFIFLQPLGDLDLSENRFLSQSFTDMFINWLRIR